MEIIAKTNGIKISTRKVRLVADSVRGMSIRNALNTLSLTQKRGASVIAKTIDAAIANAKHNANLSADSLFLHKLEVNEGPFLKRFRPSTRGRVHPYKKRSSHITVILKEVSK